jgi:hypothetical protein
MLVEEIHIFIVFVENTFNPHYDYEREKLQNHSENDNDYYFFLFPTRVKYKNHFISF